MGESQYEKYIFRMDRLKSQSHHPEITKPILRLRSPVGLGATGFVLSFEAITEPFVMEPKPMVHDFDQFLIFLGGDTTNMLDLGGEVELTLGEEGKELETFAFTTATAVHIPAGLVHCPLNFKKVNDPNRPIFFQDLFFAPQYGRREVQ